VFSRSLNVLAREFCQLWLVSSSRSSSNAKCRTNYRVSRLQTHMTSARALTPTEILVPGFRRRPTTGIVLYRNRPSPFGLECKSCYCLAPTANQYCLRCSRQLEPTRQLASISVMLRCLAVWFLTDIGYAAYAAVYWETKIGSKR